MSPAPSADDLDRAPLFSGRDPDRRQWTLAVAAGMASYLDSSILVAVGIGLAIFQDYFGLSTVAVGVLSSGLTVSIAVGALLGGRIADVFGRMRVFTVYIFIYAIGMLLMALATTNWVLFVGVAVAGLAAGADLPTSVAVVSERSPAGAQGRLVSMTQVMWFVGIGVTQVLGFALSTTGMLGIRIIFGQLVLVALGTWAVRRFHPALRSLEEDVDVIRATSARTGASAADATTGRARIQLRTILTSRSFLVPMALVGLFYVFWGLTANTFGQFQTYFLITVGGANQTTATGIGAALIPIGLLFTVVFVRVVDTRWRNKVFVGGAVLQVLAMSVAGLGNGVITVYVVALVLFNIGNNVAGEALYKVWTQESVPVEARASIQGFTYAIGRFAFAAFALVTPSLLAANATALLLLLVVFAVGATITGLVVIRYLGHRGIHPGEHDRPAGASGQGVR